MTGVLQTLSVSQVESFDPTQTGGCPRRWWFERVEGLRPEKNDAQTDGDIGHELLAHYFSTGESRQKRVKMSKTVTGAILKGELPAPGPDLLVERRFDGQAKRDAKGDWVPLDADKTLWLGGMPWDGFVDLRFRRGPARAVTVLDHKFSSDIHAYAKSADRLIDTVQLPVYCLDSLRIWPDVTVFILAHHYVSRRGVDSFMRVQAVTLERVLERKATIEHTVAEMQTVARATSQDDVPFNRRACSAYTGCPHQAICTAFRRNQMQLTADEMALFGDLEGGTGDDAAASHAAPLAPEPAGDVPPPVASTPAPQQPPACGDCGTELNANNASKLQSGHWRHIGCPAADPVGARTREPVQPSPSTTAETAPPARDRCLACPHPAHPGAPCTGKRGRGQCQCGVAGEQPANPQPLAELKPSGGAQASPCSAGTTGPLPSLPMNPEPPSRPALPGVPPVPPSSRWAGTLEVRVTVALDPTTLAFIERLFRR